MKEVSPQPKKLLSLPKKFSSLLKEINRGHPKITNKILNSSILTLNKRHEQ